MTKIREHKLILIAIAVCATLFACSGDDEDSRQATALNAASSILSFVPADSPYVFASLAPMPDDVMDKLEPTFDRMLRSYRALLQEVVASSVARSAVDGTSDEEVRKVTAVVNELSSFLSLEGLRDIGFERDSKFVAYGNGLLPVIRLELSDGALFEAALTRVEASAGEKMEMTEVAGRPVRFVDLDEVKALLAIDDRQLVISLAPTGFEEEQLAILLGFELPANDILSTETLQNLIAKYGFNEYFVGFLDVARVVSTLTGDANGLDADLLSLAGDSAALSDICRTEIRSLANIAPRLVAGYKDLSTTQFHSQAILEMRTDIAQGLQALPAAVPGLGGDHGGMLSFGMSLNPGALRQFVDKQISALEKAPYQCELLADLQGAASQARASLQQPLPPMIYDFRGMVAVIRNMEGLDMATQSPPSSVDGEFLLAMNNAPALVSLGALMSPELATLNLQADGKAVLLDLPQAQMLGQEVYVALTDDGLSMASGEDAQTRAAAILNAPSSDAGTVFSMSVDAARYYGFIAEAMAMQPHDDENPMSPEFQGAMRDLMLAVAGLYDRVTVNIRFTDAGMVMDSIVSLGQQEAK